MNFTLGQYLLWTPQYFRWDCPSVVSVDKVYTSGYALLSNGQTVDGDGIAWWDGKPPLGKVIELVEPFK